MQQRTLTLALIVAAAAFVVLGFAVHETMRFLTLTMASTTEIKFQRDFTTSFSSVLETEHPRVRSQIKTFASREKANTAFEQGQADLIVSRSDSAPRNGLGIVIVRRDLTMFIVPSWRRTESIPGLKEARIGVVGNDPHNADLLTTILAFYGVKAASATIMNAKDVRQAIHEHEIDAVFVVAPLGTSLISSVYESVHKGGSGQPRVLLVDEADAVAERDPTLESSDVPQGAIIGNPAVPDDDAKTLSVTSRLLAPASMPNAIVAELARILFKDKAKVASRLPPATSIEAPDTDTVSATLPLHPGAYAYLTGNQPSLSDQAQNAVYWGGLVASGVGSLGALGLAFARRFRTSPLERDMLELLDIWGESDVADLDALAKSDKQVDSIVHDVLRRAGGGGDPVDHSFSLIVAQVRYALERRRRALGAPRRDTPTGSSEPTYRDSVVEHEAGI